MLKSFVVGVVAGGVAYWLWGDEIRRFANTKSRTARLAAADTLKAVQSTAEDMFDSAKDQVTSTLQSGQDAIRPARANPDRQ